MVERSAGILMHRASRLGTQVLLVHPGGPFWVSKDAGAWSIPKGQINPSEEALAAAQREFGEETGAAVPATGYTPLGDFRQPSRKIITAFAVAGDFDTAGFHSNLFEMEWPPRSGLKVAFPEADRAEWFLLADADARIHVGQRPILAALAKLLGAAATATPR